MKVDDSAQEKDIGSRLKTLRKMFSYTQTAFAEAIGIGRPKLASLEEGRARLRFEVFFNLWRHCDVSPRWLATGEGLPIGAASDEFAMSPVGPRHLFSRAFARYRAENPSELYGPESIDERKFGRTVVHMMRQLQRLVNSTDEARAELLANSKLRGNLENLADRLNACLSTEAKPRAGALNRLPPRRRRKS